MKPIHFKPVGDERPNRKFALLREMRLETTQRSVVCYGWFLLSAFTILSVLVLILLQGLGRIALSDKVILALIGATVAQAIGVFATIIRRLFLKR